MSFMQVVVYGRCPRCSSNWCHAEYALSCPLCHWMSEVLVEAGQKQSIWVKAAAPQSERKSARCALTDNPHFRRFAPLYVVVMTVAAWLLGFSVWNWLIR